jgi:hypothetical protein
MRWLQERRRARVLVEVKLQRTAAGPDTLGNHQDAVITLIRSPQGFEHRRIRLKAVNHRRFESTPERVRHKPYIRANIKMTRGSRASNSKMY